MREGVEAAYQALADYVAAAIDDDWTVAWLVAEIESDEGGYTFGRYRKTPEANGPVRSFKTDASVFEVFDRLRTLLRNEDEDAWTRAVFTIRNTGRFNLELDYEPLRGSQLDRARALIARKNAESFE